VRTITVSCSLDRIIGLKVLKIKSTRGCACLARSEEHETIDLGVVSSSPTLGVEMT